jgi:hypothetical protein
VAAAGGIGPALAAGLDPADYPVVPGGVPQAWERAQVYLGLRERYQELYQTQVAELHLLMAAMPGSSMPLPHHRPRTDPLTHTRTTPYHSPLAPRTAREDRDNPDRTAVRDAAEAVIGRQGGRACRRFALTSELRSVSV